MLMSKQDKTGLVPELRFPEFLDNGMWRVSKLKTLAKRSTQKNTDGSEIRVLTNSAEYGVVDQRDYFDKDIANQSNLEGYYIVEEGDYVYNPRVSTFAPVGPISKNKIGTGVMSPLYTVFRFNNSINDFYEQYFKTVRWHTYMRTVSNTGARHDRMAISADDFMSMPLPEPHPKEQKKIADCLASIDELIIADTKKLSALKTHKKGLMQQLFPADNEPEPKLRFPEYRSNGEWKEKLVRDLGEIITGSTPSTSEREYYGGERLFVSPADISDQRFIEKTKTTLTEIGFIQTRPVKPGSILFVCIGSTIGKIAQNLQECATNQQINSVVPSASYANAFVYFCLEHKSEDISKLAGNHAVPIINKTAFGSVKIRVPDLPEQQKIADCLTSIDQLITALDQKTKALKSHKTALMQKLFPDMSEAKA